MNDIGGMTYMRPAMIPVAFFRSVMLLIFSMRWSCGTFLSFPSSDLYMSFWAPRTTSTLHCTCPKTGAGFPTATVDLFSTALLKSSAEVPENSVQLYPDVYTECASLPDISDHLPGYLSMTSLANMFEYVSGWPPLMVSKPSMSRSRIRSCRPGACMLNGCGAMARPPWERIMSMVSSTGSMSGIFSVRKRPITSPSAVVTSSPTITSMSLKLALAYFWAMNAPAISSWSVMAMTSMPSCLILSTCLSGIVVDSGNFSTPSLLKPEYSVCRWVSAFPMGRLTVSGRILDYPNRLRQA